MMPSEYRTSPTDLQASSQSRLLLKVLGLSFEEGTERTMIRYSRKTSIWRMPFGTLARYLSWVCSAQVTLQVQCSVLGDLGSLFREEKPFPCWPS